MTKDVYTFNHLSKKELIALLSTITSHPFLTHWIIRDAIANALGPENFDWSDDCTSVERTTIMIKNQERSLKEAKIYNDTNRINEIENEIVFLKSMLETDNRVDEFMKFVKEMKE